MDKQLNLYLISQNVNNDYDTYDSAVVAASDEEAARRTSPSEWFDVVYEDKADAKSHDDKPDSTWTTADNVSVKLIGTAADGVEPGRICSSYNAG
ncbi:MAG: hypothetical protein SOI13_01390 [Bifidobacterium mongoliense]|jgi:hypothetical protein|uniref:hypothetical protein n=1 Tax=Bifidobacterium mongoliense TaxID=518643 RepID=UPI002F35119C